MYGLWGRGVLPILTNPLRRLLKQAHWHCLPKDHQGLVLLRLILVVPKEIAESVQCQSGHELLNAVNSVVEMVWTGKLALPARDQPKFLLSR